MIKLRIAGTITKIHVPDEYDPPVIDNHYWKKVYPGRESKRSSTRKSKEACLRCLRKEDCKVEHK